MSAPFFAHGTTVEFGSDDVGGIVAIELPEETRGDIQTTHAQSGGDHSYKPGLRDGGVFVLECRDMPEDAGQVAMRANLAAGSLSSTLKTVTVTLPPDAAAGGTVTYTFSAYVNGISGSLPQTDDEAASSRYSMKVSGQVTKAVA